MSRIGVGYGLGGSLFYYPILGQARPDLCRQEYIEATVNEIFRRITESAWSYPDLVELFYLFGMFKDELSATHDVSGFMIQINEILLHLTTQLISER